MKIRGAFRDTHPCHIVSDQVPAQHHQLSRLPPYHPPQHPPQSRRIVVDVQKGTRTALFTLILIPINYTREHLLDRLELVSSPEPHYQPHSEHIPSLVVFLHFHEGLDGCMMDRS